MFANEILIETVVAEVPGRPSTTFEVIEEPTRFAGRRAYIKGTTKYLEMAQFEAGLAKITLVGKITRT